METAQTVVSKSKFSIWREIGIGIDYYPYPEHHVDTSFWDLVIWIEVHGEKIGVDRSFCVLTRDSGFDEKYGPIHRPIKEGRDTKLVLVSAEDLGFESDHIDYDDILKRARNCGLKTCPADVAFWLRYSYQDQPEDEILFVATELLEGLPVNFILFLYFNSRSRDHLRIGVRQATDGPFPPNGKRKLPFFGKKDKFVFCVE